MSGLKAWPEAEAYYRFKEEQFVPQLRASFAEASVTQLTAQEEGRPVTQDAVNADEPSAEKQEDQPLEHLSPSPSTKDVTLQSRAENGEYDAIIASLFGTGGVHSEELGQKLVKVSGDLSIALEMLGIDTSGGPGPQAESSKAAMTASKRVQQISGKMGSEGDMSKATSSSKENKEEKKGAKKQ